jgi:hypothetical protein
MNDDQLSQRLSDLRVPPASGSARARAKHRALIALQSANSAAPGAAETKVAWKWIGASAAVCAVVFFTIIHRLQAPAENLATDRQLFRQIEMLFPGQINSVVEQNGHVDLSIAQSSLVGSQQPVLMVFHKDSQSIHVLSYSGHRVCVLLGKEHRCFDVLAAPNGSVILEGDDNVWVTSKPVVVAGYSVEAQMLEASL